MPVLAVFRVKAMLIKTVMQGGLVAAFYEMKKRFNELAQSVGGINWVKCIKVGFEKLLNITLYANDDLGEGVDQTFSVTDQLNMGIRHLEIDITAAYFELPPKLDNA